MLGENALTVSINKYGFEDKDDSIALKPSPNLNLDSWLLTTTADKNKNRISGILLFIVP